MRAGGASGLRGSRRSSSRRTPTSITPASATQMGK